MGKKDNVSKSEIEWRAASLRPSVLPVFVNTVEVGGLLRVVAAHHGHLGLGSN